MKPRDIFHLAVRLLGLFFIYLAAKQVPLIFMGNLDDVFFPVLLSTAFYAGVAWWLLGGASILAEQAYPAYECEKRCAENSRDGGNDSI